MLIFFRSVMLVDLLNTHVARINGQAINQASIIVSCVVTTNVFLIAPTGTEGTHVYSLRT